MTDATATNTTGSQTVQREETASMQFVIREVGALDGREYAGIVLEGDTEAIRYAGSLFGERVCIIPATAIIASLSARCEELERERDAAREHGAQARIRENEAEQKRVSLSFENDRLRAALSWMDNLDPQLVEAARQKFGLPDA